MVARPSETRGARAQMVLLAALVSIGPFATNAYLPALPAVREAFGSTLVQAQFTVALPMLVFALALVVCGPASDRFGRKPVLLAGLGCFVTGSALALCAPSLTWLAIGRGIQLIGGAAGLIVTRAIVSDRYSGARAARAITALGMVSLVGHAIAPPLGGYIVLYAGWRPVFGLMCVLGVLLVVLTWRVVSVHRQPQSHAAEAAPPAAGGGFLSAKFIAGTLEIAFLYASFSAFAALAPHVMLHAYGGDAAEYGRYYMMVPAGFIVGGLLMLKLKRGIPERAIAAGFVILIFAPAVGLALTMFEVASPLAFFLPMAGVCFGHSLVIPTVSVRTVSQVAERAGTGWGVLTFTQHFTAALAVQITSSLPTDSPAPVLAICVAIGASCALLHRCVNA